jgi:cobyric acid synthase
LAAAEPKLQDVNDSADKLVAEGHGSAAEVDQSRKDLNARFAALKDKVHTAACRATHAHT